MSPDLEEKLINKYPKLFVQRSWPKTQTCMSWGICTGDGWYAIIDQMCQKIQETGVDTEFTQIKEKFGTLRVYTDHYNEEVEDILEWAYRASAQTCESCGEPGKPSKGGGWISIRCDTCRTKEDSE